MKATEILVREHKSIRLMLNVIEEMCRKLENGIEVPSHHLAEAIEFIRIFADRNHHGKEENHLFPALEAAGIPKEGGPIGVMLVEHTAGREHVAEMANAAVGYATGDKGSSAAFVSEARKYIRLLDQHIEKEDSILFPMADVHIPENVGNDMVVAFGQVDSETIGVATHERLQDILLNLKREYLQ